MKLYDYQQKIFDYVKGFNSFALFMKMGTGKTPVTIMLMKFWRVRTLVICRRNLIKKVWLAHLAEWAPDFRAVNGRTFKDNGLPNQFDVFVINYEMVRKLPPDFFRQFGLCILDESHKIKSVKSKISRFLRSCAWLFRHRLVLTGTPSDKSMLEYWPQMNFVEPKVLNPDIRVGENPFAEKHYYRFRGQHFYNYGYGGYLWNINKKEKAEVIESIRERAIFMAKEDCLDLPGETVEEYTFELDKKSKEIYDGLEENFIHKYGGHTVLASNKLAEIMKLRQITSGFFVDDQKKKIVFSDQKLKVLEEVLEDIGPKEPVIIWCQFHHEIESLSRFFGNDSRCLYGRMTEKEQDISIDTFQNGGCKYLLAHPQSGGEGLDFTNACYDVYYASSYSLLEYEQASSRTYRNGQKKKVTHIHIYADGTIGEVIFKAIMKKQKVEDAVLEMLNFKRIKV